MINKLDVKLYNFGIKGIIWPIQQPVRVQAQLIKQPI
jgi:hypothetical protein